MKHTTKILLLSAILIFTFQFSAQAQFVNNKSKKFKTIVAAGGGVAAAEMTSFSLIGGNITLEVRQPLAVFGQNLSLTGNVAVISALGNATENRSESFQYVPAGMLTVNLNAYSQAHKMARNMFGGFVGVGLLVTPEKSVNYTNSAGEELSVSSGMFGPAVVFGPRFRVGKTYMDLRVYGGLTFGGDTEMTYGGLSLMFTFGMNQKGRKGMY